MQIETIHESLLNGKRRQMVEQIKEYGVSDFFSDYTQYLYGLYSVDARYEYYTDACRSYHRIIER